MKKFIEIGDLLEFIRERIKNCDVAKKDAKAYHGAFAESYIEGAKDELIDLIDDIMEWELKD